MVIDIRKAGHYHTIPDPGLCINQRMLLSELNPMLLKEADSGFNTIRTVVVELDLELMKDLVKESAREK